MKQQQRHNEQRRLQFAAETRAQQRRIERKKNKEAADLAARVGASSYHHLLSTLLRLCFSSCFSRLPPSTDAKKKYVSDPGMRKQLLDRLIELDRDKEDRAAIREILAGVRPSMVTTQVAALATSAPVSPATGTRSAPNTPGTATRSLGTATSGTGADPASEAIRRGQAKAEAAGRLKGGITPKGPTTKAWGDVGNGLKKKRASKKSKVAPR